MVPPVLTSIGRRRKRKREKTTKIRGLQAKEEQRGFSREREECLRAPANFRPSAQLQISPEERIQGR